MPLSPADLISGWEPPWTADGARFGAAVAAQVPFDQIGVGILNAAAPQPDEVLQSRGWSEAEIDHWLHGGFENDRLLKTAMRAGFALATPAQHDSPLTAGAHAMAHMLMESPARKLWWGLLLTRRDRAFTAEEQQIAALMLRQWQVGFSQPDEPGMGRLLVGHDQRVLLADIDTQAQLLRQPSLLRELIDTLCPVIKQRYSDLADHTTVDVALNMGGRPTWVCLRRGRAIAGEGHEQWYLEFRPLEADELPPVGLVGDQRIADAIAFIHANFQRSPSLAEIARTVHVSPFHFHRLFSKQVGLSPKHYLQRKQLQVAKWLLRRRGQNIGSVAQQTGFSSHGHFTSTFHRLVGQSPSEYREKH